MGVPEVAGRVLVVMVQLHRLTRDDDLLAGGARLPHRQANRRRPELPMLGAVAILLRPTIGAPKGRPTPELVKARPADLTAPVAHLGPLYAGETNL
jgi:hypothetical protein